MMISHSPEQPDLLLQLQQQMAEFGISSVFDVVNKAVRSLFTTIRTAFLRKPSRRFTRRPRAAPARSLVTI